MLQTVQKALSETEETGWYSFNDKKGFMAAIKNKSKFKNKKYDFLFGHHTMGWADLPDWNNGKPVRNLFKELTSEERETTRYFQYYIWEDNQPKPLPPFMSQIVDAGK